MQRTPITLAYLALQNIGYRNIIFCYKYQGGRARVKKRHWGSRTEREGRKARTRTGNNSKGKEKDKERDRLSEKDRDRERDKVILREKKGTRRQDKVKDRHK